MAARYRERSDKELLRLVKDGDAAAFEEVFERFWPLLFRFVSRMLQDREAATDIVQDVLLQVWEHRDNLDENGALKSLLYTIAKNQVLMNIRRSKIEARYVAFQQQLLDEDTSPTEQHLFDKELAARIEAELVNLPPKVREAFVLSRFEDQTYREIAHQMNISDSTVKKHVSSALKRLRDKLAVLIFF